MAVGPHGLFGNNAGALATLTNFFAPIATASALPAAGVVTFSPIAGTTHTLAVVPNTASPFAASAAPTHGDHFVVVLPRNVAARPDAAELVRRAVKISGGSGPLIQILGTDGDVPRTVGSPLEEIFRLFPALPRHAIDTLMSTGTASAPAPSPARGSEGTSGAGRRRGPAGTGGEGGGPDDFTVKRPNPNRPGLIAIYPKATGSFTVAGFESGRPDVQSAATGQADGLTLTAAWSNGTQRYVFHVGGSFGRDIPPGQSDMMVGNVLVRMHTYDDQIELEPLLTLEQAPGHVNITPLVRDITVQFDVVEGTLRVWAANPSSPAKEGTPTVSSSIISGARVLFHGPLPVYGQIDPHAIIVSPRNGRDAGRRDFSHSRISGADFRIQQGGNVTFSIALLNTFNTTVEPGGGIAIRPILMSGWAYMSADDFGRIIASAEPFSEGIEGIMVSWSTVEGALIWEIDNDPGADRSFYPVNGYRLSFRNIGGALHAAASPRGTPTLTPMGPRRLPVLATRGELIKIVSGGRTKGLYHDGELGWVLAISDARQLTEGPAKSMRVLGDILPNGRIVTRGKLAVSDEAGRPLPPAEDQPGTFSPREVRIISTGGFLGIGASRFVVHAPLQR